AILVGPRRRSTPNDGQLVFGTVAQLIEPAVEPVEVLLLVLEFGRRLAHRTPFTTPAPRNRAASTLLRGATRQPIASSAGETSDEPVNLGGIGLRRPHGDAEQERRQRSGRPGHAMRDTASQLEQAIAPDRPGHLRQPE